MTTIRTELDANSALDTPRAWPVESWTRQSDKLEAQRRNARAVTWRWLLLVSLAGWAGFGYLVWALVHH